MSVLTSIAVYLTIWWVVLFMVLPYKAKADENTQVGSVVSAPAKPLLKLKFLITSLIAAIIWLVVYFLVQAGYFDFYATADAMIAADRS